MLSFLLRIVPWWAGALVIRQPGPTANMSLLMPETLVQEVSPEAASFDNFASLASDMDTIKDQVREINVVKQDVALMDHDLFVQERLWHQMETQLVDENNQLREKVRHMEAQITLGADVNGDVQMLKQSVKQAEREQALHRQQLDVAKKQWAAEELFLEAKKNKWYKWLQVVTDQANNQVHAAKEKQEQLQGDAGVLRLKVAELTDQGQTVEKQLAVKSQVRDVESAELHSKLTDMVRGLHMMTEQISNQRSQGITEVARAELQQQLKTETDELLRLQSLQGQTANQCLHAVMKRQQILRDEQTKLQARKLETTRFCGPVQAQRDVLQQWIHECEPDTLRVTPYQH